MRPRDAVRRAADYHVRALPPTLAGLAIAGAGVWYGVGADPATAAATLASAGRLVPAAGLVVVGTAVAAVGRTAVRIDATTDAVSEAAAESAPDEDDLRQTVAIATDRAVAASFEGAATEIEARVVDAVDRAASVDPATNARAGSDREGPVPRADALGAFAASDPAEPNALADATRRASERVESYLAAEDRGGDAETFRGLAEGAAVLDDESDDAGSEPEGVDSAASTPAAFDGHSAADGAEILDGDRSDGGLPDGTGGGDDAVIIDGAEADADGDADAGGDGAEMVFGGDVRDPDGDAA